MSSSRFAPVAGLAAALVGCTGGSGDHDTRETGQAIGSGAPPTFLCSFNAGPPATVPYRSRLNAVFADEPVSVDGMWQGAIGGGLWHVDCENTDCQGAADFPEGATKPLGPTGAVIGGNAFEELSWDVCPPDAIVAAGKSWSRALPATTIDDHTASWEGRRSYTITNVSSDGVMTVHIQHDTRLAYSFGTPTSQGENPWFIDGTVDATVEVCGSTPVVDQLTVNYVGPYTSGALVVSRRDAAGCRTVVPDPGPGSDVPPGPGSDPTYPGPGSDPTYPGPGSDPTDPGPGSGEIPPDAPGPGSDEPTPAPGPGSAFPLPTPVARPL